jgi:Tfp pilus assembly protein PilO
MKLGPREALFVLVILGLLGASWWFGFRKMDAKRAALEAGMAGKQAALTNLRRSTAGVENVELKLQQLADAIRFFESKLPQEKELETILDRVWKIAEANKLASRTVRTLKTERGPNYSEQQLQVTLSGDFEGFYQFLLDFEKLPRITRISKMNLQKINDEEGRMTADLVLSVFFEPDRPAKVASTR